MKEAVRNLALLFLACGVWGFIQNTDTFAADSFSVTISVYAPDENNDGYCSGGSGYPSCSSSGGHWVSYFDVRSISPSGYEQHGRFECANGDGYAAPNGSLSGTATYASSDDNYNYYNVYLNGNRDTTGGKGLSQDIKGQIKKKKVTKVKLTGYSVTTSGSGLDPDPGSKEVNKGSSASISAPSITGYDFKGWRTNKSSGTPSGGTTYTVNPLNSNTTVYAVYQKQKKTLSGVAVNTSGSVLGSSHNPNSVTVEYGNKASITRKNVSCYDFKGWRANAASGSLTSGDTFTVNSLTANKTEYAVYQIQKKTLSGVSIDLNGKEIGSNPDSKTVNCGSSAAISKKNIEGYTFRGWKKNKTDTSYTGGTGGSYTANPLNSNTTVYAVYERNRFAGRAYVTGGGVTADTGYQETNNKTESTIMECDNSGCSATFNLYLKTLAGTGSTQYLVQKRINNGSWSNVVSTTTKSPSTSGESVKSATESMKPGQKICYRITFRPYGTLANTDTRTETACITARVSTFEGLTKVTGAASESTDWQKTNAEKLKTINNCSPTNGCKVTFEHHLKRTAGIGSTDYTIIRTSNLITSTRAISNATLINNKNFRPSTDTSKNNTDVTVKTDGAHTLYPGMVVCEKMTFKPNNDTVTVASAVSTKVCISALGNAQPDDPSNPDNPEAPTNDGDTSFINIKVRNAGPEGANTCSSNVSADGCKYQRTVYAKPGDKLIYRSTYNPVLQYTYYLQPQQMRIACYNASNSLAKTAPSTTTAYSNTNALTGGGSQLGAFYNAKRTDCGDNLTKSPNTTTAQILNWNNGFSVQRHIQDRTESDTDANKFSSSVDFVNKYTQTVGLMTRLSRNNTYKNSTTGVAEAEVGKSINYRAMTNVSGTNNNYSSTRTAPGQVSFTNSSNNNLGTVSTQARSKIAYARVPYNFITTITTPEIPGDDNANDPENPSNPTNPNPNNDHDIIFAGEETPTISFEIKLNNKKNSKTTDGTEAKAYTTKADEVRRELIVYNPNKVNSSVINTKKGGGEVSGGRTADVCSLYLGLANNEVDCGYAKIGDKDTGDHNKDYTEDVAKTGKKIQATFVAQDLEAGSEICVAAAVFPANSGADTNWNNMNYSSSWRISQSKCFIIAKKPSLEVWGDNFYSAGEINTATAVKKHLREYVTNYSVAKGDKNNASAKPYVFGSWEELGIISNGSISGFASGASLGYARNDNGTLIPNYRPTDGMSNVKVSGNTRASTGDNPGGSRTSTLSALSPLTFPNTNIGLASFSGLGNSIAANNAKDKQNTIKDKYLYGGDNTINTTTVDLNDEANIEGMGEKVKGNGIYYYYNKDSDLTLSGNDLKKNTIKIVHTNKNVIINGDIKYNDEYHNLLEVPKLIIYAKNIAIDCTVSEVDAILMAKNNIITCNNVAGDDGAVNYDDYATLTKNTKKHINEQANSHPLTVRGAVMTGRLIANRTYGAATGANSMISAEIIILDPTLYQWGRDENGNTNGIDDLGSGAETSSSTSSTIKSNANMDTVYHKELAPRL